MTLLAIALGLAAANLCVYASLAPLYSTRLGGLADLGLLVAGLAAFVLVPLGLGNRWNLRQRRLLKEVDERRTLVLVVFWWNLVAAAAILWAIPRHELKARARWLPSRLAALASEAARAHDEAEPEPDAVTPLEAGSAVANSGAAEMLGYINEARRSRGVLPLREHPRLTAVALGWAETLASKGQLTHHLEGAFGDHPHAYYRHYPVGTRASGENVGVGPSLRIIFEGMYRGEQDAKGNCLPGKAGGHCRNILDPKFNVVGIGDVQKGPYHWLVQDFGGYR